MAISQQIAVLGNEGQLGAELVRQLAAAAIPLGRKECDLADFPVTRDALMRAAPRVVINTAGYTKVDLAEQNEAECMRVNADAVNNLAKVCDELDCVLVQISTDYVFGADEQRRTPYKENDPPGPLGVYARSKATGEQAATTWRRHLIVRTCGLYGPRTKPRQVNFVDTILRLARERDRLSVVNDQHCTPSYVQDIARAILFLVRQEEYGVFHIVNGGSTNWYEFAQQVFRYAGIATPIEPITTAEYGAVARRPLYSALDTAKYNALDGPRLSPWESALRRCLRAIGAAKRDGKSDVSRAA